jgi:hypoxanthine phosphoribosyltransferase
MDTGNAPRVLIDRDRIAATVDRLAGEIAAEYRDRNPLLLGILKGGIVFLADLVRRLDFALEIDCIKVSSYTDGRESAGTIEMVHGLNTDIAGRHVLVVEDIIDTGITLSFLMEYLEKLNPASLRLCALLDKPSRRKRNVHIDYTGITVPDEFLVGYGLDCAEKYRNLPDICVLEE